MTTSSLAPAETVDVAIIGGGASGMLVAIHLLQTAPQSMRILIIESRDGLAQGAAYSTVYPEHLLNVIASRVSAFNDDPGHFVRFLASSPSPGEPVVDSAVLATRFATRRDFGRYLRATLDVHPAAGQVQWLRDEAVDVAPGLPVTITLRSGANVSARTVVLAVGNSARPLPLPASAIEGQPTVIEAWDYASIRGIDTDAAVCILGSGLSMVDAVVSLSSTGHRGPITVVSRHGMRPLPHARPGDQKGDVDDLLTLGLRQRFRTIRERAEAAMRAGEPWQWTMDRLRHHVQSLWTSLSETDQRRFLRHGVRTWDIHRHRIAPSAAACIETSLASGQLEVVAGRVRSLSGTNRQLVVRPRGGNEERTIRADVVINGTGVESAVGRMRSPVIAALVKRGTITPGPHGIGIATDATGAVIDCNGIAIDNLLTIGALRIGSLWESIAIPELRGQGQRIAGRVAVLASKTPLSMDE